MKHSILTILSLIVLLVPWSAALGAGPTNSTAWVQLAWDSSPGTNVITNYSVYYGPATFTYTNKVVTGTNLTATVSNLVRGSTYFFSATATSSIGLESTNSNEVVWTSSTPPPPPTLFRLIIGN